MLILLEYISSYKESDLQEDDNDISMLILFPLISISVVVIFLLISKNGSLTNIVALLITVCSMLMILSNILVFGFYNYLKLKNSKNTDIKLQLQRESDLSRYYKLLIEQDESQKILIHDIKKHLFSIKAINAAGTSDEVDSYLDTIIDSHELTAFHKVSDNDTVNAIVGRFQKLCNDRHITLHIDIRSKCLDFMKDTDITSLLFNMFDNAVEACSGMDESEISLVICPKEQSVYTMINMVNSCRMDPFDEFGELKTSKKDSSYHGFGMKIISRIVDKYNGQMNTYYGDDNRFHLIIIVDNTL